MNKSIDTNCEY